MKKSMFVGITGIIMIGLAACADEKSQSGNETKTLAEENGENNGTDEVENGEIKKEITLEDVLNHAETPAEDFEYNIIEHGGDIGEKVEITGYKGSDTIVVIPEKIEGRDVISAKGFANDSTVRGVKISDSIEELGDRMFCNNENIEIVVLGDNVKNVGEGCFVFTGNLKQVILNEGLTSIETMAFSTSSESFKEIYIPESVVTINGTILDSDRVTMHVKSGSYAEQYAIENEIQYIVKTY